MAITMRASSRTGHALSRTRLPREWIRRGGPIPWGTRWLADLVTSGRAAVEARTGGAWILYVRADVELGLRVLSAAS
jgi:hypothetical protein